MKNIMKKLQNAFLAFEKGRIKQAEMLYLECIDKITDKESQLFKQALHGLGLVKCEQENYNEARELYLQLLRMARQEENKESEAISLHQIGMVERLAGNLERAFQLFKEEEEVYINLEGSFSLELAAVYYERGIILMQQNELKHAKHEMNSALKEADKCSDMMVTGYIYHKLGDITSQCDEIEKSRIFYNQARAIFQQAGDTNNAQKIEEKLARM